MSTLSTLYAIRIHCRPQIVAYCYICNQEFTRQEVQGDNENMPCGHSVTHLRERQEVLRR